MEMLQTQTNPPAPPRIPTGQELYDLIMGQIEPDLTTENVKQLSRLYKDETSEQLTQRRKRYDVAVERYKQAYDEYVATLRAQVERYKRQAFDHAEIQDRGVENGFLGALHQSILKFS